MAANLTNILVPAEVTVCVGVLLSMSCSITLKFCNNSLRQVLSVLFYNEKTGLREVKYLVSRKVTHLIRSNACKVEVEPLRGRVHVLLNSDYPSGARAKHSYKVIASPQSAVSLDTSALLVFVILTRSPIKISSAYTALCLSLCMASSFYLLKV